ncbi:hypothetical protein EJB05_54746, partial [Eragrostis curvula]
MHRKAEELFTRLDIVIAIRVSQPSHLHRRFPFLNLTSQPSVIRWLFGAVLSSTSFGKQGTQLRCWCSRFPLTLESMSTTKSTPCPKDDAHANCCYRWIVWVTESRLAAFIFGTLLYILICAGCILFVQYDRASAAARAQPNLFIRLAGVEGLDPGASPPSPPTFHLVVDADGVSPYYESCNGGGSSMLRLSYHGMILAWGDVPWFCIRGSRGSTDGVVTVEAKAEAAALREDVRDLVWSEQHVVGISEFDVEGEVEGLGYLHCKTFLLFRGNTTAENEGLCLVQ